MPDPPGLRRPIVAQLLIALASCCLFFLGSLLADRLIGVVVPAIPVRIANPKHFHETRRTLEFSYEFTTNSQGLRYHELPLKKASDEEFRAVVLGDSMTEGTGVEADQTFSTLLEKSDSKPERPAFFINCGLGGTGPLEYGRILAGVGLKYNPNLVLVALHMNDLTDTPEGADLNIVRSGAKKYRVLGPKFLYPPASRLHRVASALWPWSYARLQNVVAQRERAHLEQELGLIERVKEKARRLGISDARVREWQEKVPPEIVAACDRREFNATLAAMGCLYPNYLVDNLDVGAEAAEKKWVSMRHLLDQIVEIGRVEGIKVAVLYTPTSFQYDETIGSLMKTVGVRVRPEWLTEDTSEIERRLSRWADESGVAFLSLTKAFRAAAAIRKGQLNYPLDGHWTADGHRVAAGAIGHWLVEQGLLTPPSWRRLANVSDSALASFSHAERRHRARGQQLLPRTVCRRRRT